MKIELEQYTPEWVKLFEKERDLLKSKIGNYLLGSIEHVGSTSVPGLSAKPIVDIMFGVKDLQSSKQAIEELTEIDYCYYPYKKEVMHWFCKPSPEHRTHHLHLIPFQSKLWEERVRFRDILRSQPEVAGKYERLKRSLASEFSNDREAYTDNKGPFIKAILSNGHY